MAKHKPIVIIPTYNRKDFILKHIALLKQQTLVPDILIVDNASTDGTAEAIKDLEGVILLQMKENLGPAGAYHAGQKYALKNGYEIIINADDDALPTDANLIEKSVELINKGNRVVFQRRKLDKNKFQQVGVNWYGVFHRSVFEEIGIYNPLVPFFEDTDFEIRMKKAGISPADSGCYVDHPAALGRIGTFSYYYRLLNPLIIFTYHGMLKELVLRWAIILQATLISFFKGPFKPSFYFSLIKDYLFFDTSRFTPKKFENTYKRRSVKRIREHKVFVATGGFEQYDLYHLSQLKKAFPFLKNKELFIPQFREKNEKFSQKLVCWVKANFFTRVFFPSTIILTGNYHYLTTFLLDKKTYGVDLDSPELFLHAENKMRIFSISLFFISAFISMFLLPFILLFFPIKNKRLKKMERLLFDFR